MSDEAPVKHAFLSYARENATEASRLRKFLEAAEIPVWMDTESLTPGQDWQPEVKKAISAGALVFIARFSKTAMNKATGYQREELVLAVEQMRQMVPGTPWIIPVRFDDCEIPEYSLGTGRSLHSLHRVDFFSDAWETNAARLLASIQRIFGVQSTRARRPR